MDKATLSTGVSRRIVTAILALLLLTIVPVHAQPLGEWVYTARPGDTLPEVAVRYMKDSSEWHQLLRHNNLPSSVKLEPGTQVKIPLQWLKFQPRPARILSVRGEVWYRKAHTQRYLPALPETLLQVGDELKTGNGIGLVRFYDGSRLRVNESSLVVFNTLTHFGDTGMVDTRMRLLKGGIETQVSPRKGPSSKFEVSTPSAVASVRGTAFRLREQKHSTVIEVTEGVMNVNTGGIAMDVSAGQGARVQPRLAVVSLLPPPDLTIPASLSRLPYQLQWQPLPGAASYYIEISPAGEEHLPIASVELETNQWQLPLLENGQYQVVIRGISPDDIEGLDTRLTFRVAQRVVAANLQAPMPGAIFHKERPEFRWNAEAPAQRSSLEIATDEEFATLVAQTDFTLATSVPSPLSLSPGEYYWRVVTMAGADEFSYSETRPFTVTGDLEPTEIIAVNYLPDEIKVFWKSVEDAEAYEVQVAEDPLFVKALVTLEVDTTFATLRLLKDRPYWVRVKGLGGELFSSEFGPAQRIHAENTR